MQYLGTGSKVPLTRPTPQHKKKNAKFGISQEGLVKTLTNMDYELAFSSYKFIFLSN